MVVGNNWLYEAVRGQGDGLGVKVGYIELCVDREMDLE
jgi:hypothetical protein